MNGRFSSGNRCSTPTCGGLRYPGHFSKLATRTEIKRATFRATPPAVRRIGKPVHKNRRIANVQVVFEKLPVTEQGALLKLIKCYVTKKSPLPREVGGEKVKELFTGSVRPDQRAFLKQIRSVITAKGWS